MSDNSDFFSKEDFIQWVEGLDTQVLTEELKSTIIGEFESISEAKKIVLAIDFDLTICLSEYPALGLMRDGADKVIRRLHNEGYGIVINTCRAGKFQGDAEKWLDEHKIPYDYINCNFPHLIEFYGADCRKISADMYIDDKGLIELPHWDKIYEIVREKFKNQ